MQLQIAGLRHLGTKVSTSIPFAQKLEELIHQYYCFLTGQVDIENV